MPAGASRIPTPYLTFHATTATELWRTQTFVSDSTTYTTVVNIAGTPAAQASAAAAKTNSNSTSGTGLTPGQLGGIVVGSVLGFILLVTILLCCCTGRRSGKSPGGSDIESSEISPVRPPTVRPPWGTQQPIIVEPPLRTSRPHDPPPVIVKPDRVTGKPIKHLTRKRPKRPGLPRGTTIKGGQVLPPPGKGYAYKRSASRKEEISTIRLH